MQIHHVEKIDQVVSVLDPVHGIVRRKESVIKQSSVTSIDGKYKIQKDGSFDVPADVAEFLCNTPGWYLGMNPYAEEYLKAQAA
jgi:hypothetical protein